MLPHDFDITETKLDCLLGLEFHISPWKRASLLVCRSSSRSQTPPRIASPGKGVPTESALPPPPVRDDKAEAKTQPKAELKPEPKRVPEVDAKPTAMVMDEPAAKLEPPAKVSAVQSAWNFCCISSLALCRFLCTLGLVSI